MLRNFLMVVLSAIVCFSAFGMLSKKVNAQDFPEYYFDMYFDEEVDFGESGAYMFMDELNVITAILKQDKYIIEATGKLTFHLLEEKPTAEQPHVGTNMPPFYFYKIKVSPSCPVYGTFIGATGDVTDNLYIMGIYPDKKPVGVRIYSGAGTLANPYMLEVIYDGIRGDRPHFAPNPSPAPVDDNVTVTLNGQAISFDQPPIIVDSRTLVPLRAIFEAMGAEVEWIQASQTVTAAKDDIAISLQIGSNKLYKNGEVIELDVPAQVVNERTLVPVRAISEAFGAEVDWDNDTRTVIIAY